MNNMPAKPSLRDMPKVDVLLGGAEFAPLVARHGRPLVTEELRAHLDDLRARLRGEAAVGADELAAPAVARACEARLRKLSAPVQCRVINATGTILHTSLGRAPLAPEVAQAAIREAAQYSALELDRDSGKRSDRDKLISGLLQRITGAEAATVVNNNAAATMIILDTMANGREVICSRAHMVEIGGSYRMPDVMRKAGCKLVEVGCTNKTHPRDFENAISDQTAMLLKVHTSNYAIVGFVEEPSLEELVEIGRRRNVPVVYDLGAGSLVDLRRFGVSREPTVQELLKMGADLVCFSGDKLFGGPQAGMIVGRKDLVQRVKKNQLFRMVRCDKVTLSLLEHTLRLYLDPERILEAVPTLRMISRHPDDVRKSAKTVATRLAKAGLKVDLADSQSQIGGGSTPGEFLPTTVVVIRSLGGSPDEAAQRLRVGTPSVFCRIENDALVFDARTLLPGQDAELVEAILAARA
ncbi:MAG: L-seryl-tRNA(Sec) selenium transferase [Planctomycetes bacterium]|nr:L-seryl-tRNA(Sec) selenium transferase [Planctomycetota bacterium]